MDDVLSMAEGPPQQAPPPENGSSREPTGYDPRQAGRSGSRSAPRPRTPESQPAAQDAAPRPEASPAPDELLDQAPRVDPFSSGDADEEAPPPNSGSRQDRSQQNRSRADRSQQDRARQKRSPADTQTRLESDTETAASLSESGQSDRLIRLRCPNCDNRFRVRREKAGKKVSCPKCETAVKVPRPSPSAGRLQQRPADKYRKLAEALPEPHKADAAEAAKKRGKRLSHRAVRKLEKAAGPRAASKGETRSEAISRRKDALSKLAQSGDPGVFDAIAAQLEDGSVSVRTAAAEALGDLGDLRGTPLLLGLLDCEVADLRKTAVAALGKLSDRRAVKPLLEYALDEPATKYVVAAAVNSIGETAVPELLEVLDHRDPGIVLEAIVLLGRLRNKKATPALISIAETRSTLLRQQAAEALGLLSDERAAPALCEMLQDEDTGVRVSAASALGRMPRVANVKALVRALRDVDHDVRSLAATALGETGERRAGDSLVRLLDDDHPSVGTAALEALGKLGDERAVEPLLEMLGSAEEDEVLKAMNGLRRFRQQRVVEPLVEFLHHEKSSFRQRAAECLGNMGDAFAAERLERVLVSDRSPDVRLAAAKALGEIGDPGSTEALERALQDEFQVRCRAVVSLGQIAEETSLPALLAAMKDPMPEVRYQSTVAVGEIGNTNAMAPLEMLLDDDEAMVRRGAAKALVKLGDPRGDELLEQAGAPKKRKASRRRTLTRGGRPRFDFSGLKSVSMSGLLQRVQDSKGTQLALASLVGLPLLIVVLWSVFSKPPDRIVLRGRFVSAAVSADGSRVAVGRSRGMVEIFDGETGKLVEQFPVELGSIDHIATGPDGKTLLLASGNRIVFRQTDGSLVELSGHTKPVQSTNVTPDRSRALTVGGDGTAILWNLRDGSSLANIRLPAEGLDTVALSPDGSRFAVGSAAGVVEVYEVADPAQPLVYRGAEGRITALALGTEARRVLAGTDQGHVAVWEVGNSQVSGTTKFENGAIRDLQPLAAEGEFAVLQHSRIVLWQTGTDEKQPVKLPAARASVAPSGTVAVTTEEEEEPQLLRLPSGEVVSTLVGPSSH